jgi:hypothetical protein
LFEIGRVFQSIIYDAKDQLENFKECRDSAEKRYIEHKSSTLNPERKKNQTILFG